MPVGSLWLNAQGVGMGSSSGGSFGGTMLYAKSWETYGGGVPVPYPPEVVQVDGQPVVVVAAGTHLLGLDAHMGKPTWPPYDLLAPINRMTAYHLHDCRAAASYHQNGASKAVDRMPHSG